MKLFAFLPPWREAPSGKGRKPIDRSCLLKALVYQRLRRMRFLRDLHTHLRESPPIMAALGFNPHQEPSTLKRFSAFLSDSSHRCFVQIRVALTGALQQDGVMKGSRLALNSCPIESWIRENNLKNDLRHRRFDKTIPPKGDTDARLGVHFHFLNPDETRLDYFWGYRNHTVADLESELPLGEITEPNSVAETTLALPLLQATTEAFTGTHKRSIVLPTSPCIGMVA